MCSNVHASLFLPCSLVSKLWSFKLLPLLLSLFLLLELCTFADAIVIFHHLIVPLSFGAVVNQFLVRSLPRKAHYWRKAKNRIHVVDDPTLRYFVAGISASNNSRELLSLFFILEIVQVAIPSYLGANTGSRNDGVSIVSLWLNSHLYAAILERMLNDQFILFRVTDCVEIDSFHLKPYSSDLLDKLDSCVVWYLVEVLATFVPVSEHSVAQVLGREWGCEETNIVKLCLIHLFKYFISLLFREFLRVLETVSLLHVLREVVIFSWPESSSVHHRA